MKKVMFLIVSMLFAANVNAATLDLSYAGGVIIPPGVAGVLQSSGQYVTGTASVDGAQPLVSNWGLTTDTDVLATFNVGFSNLAVGQSVSVSSTNSGYNLFEDGVLVASAVAASSVGFTFDYVLRSLSAYTFGIIGDATGVTPTTTHLQVSTPVSAVPVPAALFLFAPALLGFLGFRRKAAVQA